ncbi:MAG: signal peptidase II [Rhodospirillaceae bacterium]|jgi:signal peptidase II|nr:signal peptidase II [Rhodospirillaceae bacterium]
MTPFRAGSLIVVAMIVFDQLSKWWILSVVMQPPQRIPVTGFFDLVLVMNRGVSFGMLGGAPGWVSIGLIVFAIFLAVGLSIWMWRAETMLLGLSLGLVVGGAIGNVIDRIRFGAVVDFLDFYVGTYHWPAFNVADSAITVGVILLILDSLKSGHEKP